MSTGYIVLRVILDHEKRARIFEQLSLQHKFGKRLRKDANQFANISKREDRSIIIRTVRRSDKKNLRSLFSEISQIIGTGTNASERNEANDGQMEEKE